jgi:hypothetical protein
MQRWRFLVIRDPKIKQTVGALYKRAWDEQVAPRYRAGEPAPGMSRERFLPLLDAAEFLATHIHEAPVWIVPCLEGGTPTRTSGSSIYPAVQNMVAGGESARPRRDSDDALFAVRERSGGALGLPPNVHSYALLPIGYLWAGSVQSAVCRWPMSSTRIAGVSLPGLGIRPLHPRKAKLRPSGATRLQRSSRDFYGSAATCRPA